MRRGTIIFIIRRTGEQFDYGVFATLLIGHPCCCSDGQASKDPDASLKFGPDSGFHSKHQRYISKDRDLLKILETAIQKGGHAGTPLALQHHCFIFPLI